MYGHLTGDVVSNIVTHSVTFYVSSNFTCTHTGGLAPLTKVALHSPTHGGVL